MNSTVFFNIDSEQSFFEKLHDLSEHCTISDLWSALKEGVVIDSPDITLACADIAMCAGEKDEAFKLYNIWVEKYRGSIAFLPFTRSRIAADRLLRPIILEFCNLVDDDDVIINLIGVGALFCLGKWAALEKYVNKYDNLSHVNWRISAAIGFAKAALYDYPNASAFFIPAVIEGHGASIPYNGVHESIAHAAEQCANLARKHTVTERSAERLLISRGGVQKFSSKPIDMTKVDLFIKTCAKDEQFLIYCLKSIDIFLKKFRRVVIVTDEGHNCDFNLNYDHVIHKITVPAAPPKFGMPPGYRMQMVVKLRWTDFTDADAVVITDSDTIFTRPFCPEDMFVDGNPVWYYGEWGEGIAWRAGTELVVGAPMPFCCMREHPFIFTRSATEGFADYIARRFDCSIFDLFFGEEIPGAFCEFEILGGYISHVCDHKYKLIKHSHMGIVRQYWSWGGFTDEVKSNIDQHLKVGLEKLPAPLN